MQASCSHSFVHSFIPSSINSSIPPSLHSLARWFVDSWTHWFLGSFLFMVSLVHRFIHTWLIQWSVLRCFNDSASHWCIDSAVHRFIGSFVHWFLCTDSFMSFHCHLRHHLLIRWCTSQLPSWLLHLKPLLCAIEFLQSFQFISYFSKCPPGHGPGIFWYGMW